MNALIFDLDGTLLNTLADIANACNTILIKYGYPAHSIPAYKQMVGNGFDILVRRAIAPAVIPDNIEGIVAEAREYYATHMMKETEPYPGMVETLETLATQAKLAVLSNKPDNLSRELIPHYFAHIPFFKVIGAKQDVPLKPNPSSLVNLLQEMAIPQENAFYVGDSNVDMETAHNAGISAIGAAWGFRGAEELEQAHATKIFLEPCQLLTLMN